MALTITKTGDWSGIVGTLRYARVQIAFDSSYATGGESLTPADLGLRVIDHIEITSKSGYVFEYDYTGKLVLVYRTAGFTPAGTLSTPSFTVKGAGTVGSSMLVGLTIDSTTALFQGQTSITTDRTLAGTYSPVGVSTYTGSAVAAATLIEVANATNLSTLTGVRVYAIGV